MTRRDFIAGMIATGVLALSPFKPEPRVPIDGWITPTGQIKLRPGMAYITLENDNPSAGTVRAYMGEST